MQTEGEIALMASPKVTEKSSDTRVMAVKKREDQESDVRNKKLAAGSMIRYQLTEEV